MRLRRRRRQTRQHPVTRLVRLCRQLAVLVAVLPALALAQSRDSASTSPFDTVHVAAPTGEKDIDRASILAALDEVEPGGTIRFAPGTYLVGEIIHVTVPGITVLGHREGTTLRGCHPDMFPRQGGMEEMFVAVVSCNGLDMAGGHQTVRGLTFEHAWHALILGGMECMEGRGCVPVLEPVESRTGAYRVEDNTFRNTVNGIRTLGQWSEPAVIRGNRFINTFHAVVVHGSVVHVVENEISVPEPERVPTGHPGGAMTVSATDLNLETALLCAGNVIAGNRIRGHPDGIAISLLRAGASCRGNVIRQNTIAVERVQVTASWWGVTHTESDSSAVGVPIALINAPKAEPEVSGSAEVDEQEGMLEDNLIEGNAISGAEGIGIELLHASGNRIVNNTITGVARRDPFPGITVNSFDPQKSGWREASGSGIWVSPGSDENEFLENTFEDIASDAIVLAGDRNHVELTDPADAVRDLGTDNRVRVPGGQTPPGDRAGAQLPRAHPNDHRTPAGQVVDGELRVELEAIEAEWYPRGPDGPRIVTAAFAEPGGPPQVPGPLIRAAAGTPVRVSVRNRLDRAITVRGLLDRAAMDAPERPEDADPADADFFFADSLVVPAGETREVRFVPTAEVSSFYYGRLAPEEGGFANPTPLPGNFGDEGVFLGGLVVDPADVSHPPDERVFLITRWAGRSEPSTLAVTFKFMINGLSWPFTERLEHEVGDTVRWRLINASSITHPMHLHGFYFTVDGRGDTDADTVYAAGVRRAVVTDVMPDFSSLRLTWVPERPGNWLFHCHLIRHMGALQRFAEEGGPGGEGMAGLVMGLVVRPRPGAVQEEPEPERTIHLWTSRAPDVFDGLPELSFVAREGPGAPRLDTAVVPGSALVLERGQPTEIVVHNRLDAPMSVHWHGLEVRSLYDGVGNWSGRPGATRPPIAPGDSARVYITPPRAGTFIYHVHGETGHELSQGLYGPFLVLPEGEMRDPERDRVYVLAARGARRDPPPVVNGHPSPPPERFAPGGTYRLRFIHISPDARKRVRLLKNGEPVRWRPLAKDGADLPDAARVPEPASADLGVGETFDAEWTPAAPGTYTLEVVTTHYSASGLPPTVQRIAFGVGEVSDEALVAAHVEPPAPRPPSPLDTVPAIALDERELRRLVGTYAAPGVPVEFVVEWREPGLWMSVTGQEPRPLVPLSPMVFRWEDDPSVRVEFDRQDDRTVMLVFGMRLAR